MEWDRNPRNTSAATFTDRQIWIGTDFAAALKYKGSCSMTCGTSAHVNKAVFVVLSNPRLVNSTVGGKQVETKIHDCDSWAFFLPTATKYKENCNFAHHECVGAICGFYKAE